MHATINDLMNGDTQGSSIEALAEALDGLLCDADAASKRFHARGRTSTPLSGRTSITRPIRRDRTPSRACSSTSLRGRARAFFMAAKLFTARSGPTVRAVLT